VTGVLAQAVVPTARAVRWAPPALVAGLLLLVVGLAGTSARPADTVLAIAAAGLAATVVSGLHDPAATLLAAVPVSAMRRRLLRLGLLGAPALLLWWALATLAPATTHAGPGPLMALASCGVAVAVWAPMTRAVLLGAATPVAVFAVGRVAPAGSTASDVLGWWLTDPWWVLAAASLLCVLGRRR
jgi:hypothetical protein